MFKIPVFEIAMLLRLLIKESQFFTLMTKSRGSLGKTVFTKKVSRLTTAFQPKSNVKGRYSNAWSFPSKRSLFMEWIKETSLITGTNASSNFWGTIGDRIIHELDRNCSKNRLHAASLLRTMRSNCHTFPYKARYFSVIGFFLNSSDWPTAILAVLAVS